MRRHVAIVGYGTAGQACALALTRAGHSVEIFERVPEPGPVGAGFLLQPTGLQALWQLGLLDAVRGHGAPVTRLYGENTQGRTVMDMRYADLDVRLHGLGIQRGALFSILHDAMAGKAPIEAGTRIEEIDHAAGRLRDHHGCWHGPFDLVVVADGAASRLRQGVSSPSVNQPYPWGALWCLLPVQAWPWRDELRQRYRLARNMAGLLPVGTAPGDPIPRLGFFWSVPVEVFEHWHREGAADWRSQLRDVWPEADDLLGDDFDATQLARAAYRDAVMPGWWRGRTVLVGDAAHAMSPQLGQGANMALQDAVTLAESLERHASLPEALTRFTGLRRKHLAAYHRWSRWLTPLFQSRHDTLARVRDFTFLPSGGLPGARGHMLRVLSGTQQGWFGRFPLQEGFLQAWSAPAVVQSRNCSLANSA